MLIKNILILFLFFLSIQAHARNKWMLKDVYVNGLIHTSRVEVLNYIKSFYHRDIIFSKDIYEISHILLKTHRFKNIKIQEYKNNLIMYFIERPTIIKIDYIGYNCIKNSNSNKLLQNFNFRPGIIFHKNALKKIIKKIKKYYIYINKKNINIKIIVVFAKHNSIFLKIIFSEFKNYKIGKINITGNRVFSKENILLLLKSQDSLNSEYNIKKLENDIKKLKYFYINHGYINFIINHINIIYDVNKNRINININYIEGKKFIIKNIFLHQDILLNFQAINKRIKNVIYQPYCVENILDIKNNIKDIFVLNGYIDVRISMNYTIDKLTSEIIFYFNIYSGKLYFLHKIHFYNSKYITDKNFYNKIKNLEGHFLNIKTLSQIKENIIRNGYCNHVSLNLYPIKNHSNNIDVIYTLKKTETGNINFNLGYGLHNGISFTLKLIQNDLLHSGIDVKLNSMKDDYESFNDITLINSNIFAFGDVFQGKLFYNIFNSDPVKNNVLKNKNYGINSEFGFAFNQENKLNLGIEFIHNDFFNPTSKFSIWNYSKLLKNDFDKYNIKCVQKNNINYSFFWSYDSLNTHFFPVSGNYTTFSIKSNIPVLNDFFYLIKLDTIEYFPLTTNNNLLLLLHANLGLKSNVKLKNFYKYEDFYTGGMGTIRGFKTNSIGSKFIYYNPMQNLCVGKQNYKFCESNDYTASDTMIVTNIELVAPFDLYQNKSLNIIRSSIFFDAASIWNINLVRSLDAQLSNIFNYNNPNKVRMSMGFSLQWKSPLGPLQCSYAYPLQFFSEDQIEQFQFNIGKSW